MKKDLLKICGCDLKEVPSLNFVEDDNFMKIANRESKKDHLGFYSDQFDNLDNAKGHAEDTGPEILTQMEGKIDYFITGAGTGGTLAGVGYYLKKHNKKIKIFLADKTGSALYHRIKHGTLYNDNDREGYNVRHPLYSLVEGIGLNRLSANFELALEKGLIDDAVLVSDEEALNMVFYLIEKEGLFVGSSSALHIAAACKLARRVEKGSRIVTLACDDGTRHMSKFFNPKKWASYGFEYPKDLPGRKGSLSFLKE